VSPRPRTVEDAEIFEACQRVMQRTGPARFTLALVAKEAGLSPATLVQRFGSKRKLLQALSASSTGFGHYFVAQLRTQHSSPLQVAREFLLCFAEMASTPAEMANHLAWLQMDLTDPVMHRNLLDLSQDNLAILSGLLGEAVAAGELLPNDSPALARVLSALTTGGLLAWATFREGTARGWLEQDIDLVLRPYLRG
jgi:AcrR family transcriptional regulator